MPAAAARGGRRRRGQAPWPEFDWRLSTHAIKDMAIQLATIDHPIAILTMTARDVPGRARIPGQAAPAAAGEAFAQVLFELAQTRSVLNAYRPKRAAVITATSHASEMTDFSMAPSIRLQRKRRAAGLVHAGPRIGWEDVPTSAAWMRTKSTRPHSRGCARPASTQRYRS